MDNAWGGPKAPNVVHKVPKQDVWTFWGTRCQKERKAILDNVQAFFDISGHDYGDDYDDDSDGNDDNDDNANLII